MSRSTRRSLAPMATALALILAGCGGAPDAVERPEPAAAERGEKPPPQPEQPIPQLRGGERLVFFGDSLAAEAPPTYADLLAAELEHEAPGLEVVNLSRPGSTSEAWLPGAPLFERGLAPALDGAALVFVTVGGNDLEAALGAADGIDALGRAPAAAERLRDAERRVARNLRRIFAEIRDRNGRAAIVYVSYPDYSAATAWREAAGTLGTLALRLGLRAMLRGAERAGPDLAVDMLSATAKREVDELLADPEHLSPAGHALYARRIARALRG